MRISLTTTAPVAMKAEGFSRVSRVNTLRVGCRTMNRLKAWKNTKVTNAIVGATVACPGRASGPGAHARTASVPPAITALPIMIRRSR